MTTAICQFVSEKRTSNHLGRVRFSGNSSASTIAKVAGPRAAYLQSAFSTPETAGLAHYFFTVNCNVTECCNEPLAAFSVIV